VFQTLNIFKLQGMLDVMCVPYVGITGNKTGSYNTGQTNLDAVNALYAPIHSILTNGKWK
jgi:hypothetical protein